MGCTTGTVFDNTAKTWTIANLNSTARTYVLKLVTRVMVSNQNVTNKTFVTYNGINSVKNDTNSTIEVLPSSNLQINKIIVDAKESYVIGDEIKWSITVENIGEDAANNVVVNDVMDGFTITSYETPGSTTFEDGVWTIGSLNPNTPITLNVTTKIIKSDVTGWNYVNVTTTSHDNPFNNKTRNITVTVLPNANVTINKDINGSTNVVGIGDNVTWIITVKHDSGDALTNVTVSEVIPEGLELVDVIDPEGTYYNETSGIWTIDKLNDSNSTYDLVLITKVLISDKNITNFANVSYDGSNTGKNETNRTVIVLPNADVEVSIDVNLNETQKDSIVDWVINVVNYGNDTAPLVDVNITLPDGVELIDVILPNGTTFNNETGIWSIPKLDVNQNLTPHLIIVVNATNTTLTESINNVTFNGTNPSNNTVNNATLNVLPSVDLNLNVTVDPHEAVVGEEVKVTVVSDNYGPDVAENTNVTINLPDGFEITSIQCANGTFVPAKGNWILSNIALGKYVLVITGVFTKSGDYNITATVHTTTPIALKAVGNLTSVDNITVKDVPVNNNGKGIGMLPTGNPLVFALLALLIIPLRLRRRK